MKNGLSINVNNTKVMVFEREEDVSVCEVKINDVSVEQMKESVYLGSMFTRDGKIDADVERRVHTITPVFPEGLGRSVLMYTHSSPVCLGPM